MEDKKTKPSTAPYKGVRDFYPEEQSVQNYIFGVMRKTAESFGYSEYGASILESSEIYRGKTSEEIVNEQTYTFTDRGEREVTLRPEMTPSVARMIAARRRELAFPLRWYSIPNMFRYERPQRGRLREHWQLNCDLFGISEIEAEAEIISLAYSVMKNFGAGDDDFEIKINDRKLLNEKFGKKELIHLLDRKEKIEPAEFEAEWEKLSGNKPDFDMKPNEKIGELMKILKTRGINSSFSPTLTRGFDYYTGIVFEIFDTNPSNNRSLFGGGRYDNLLQIFDEEPVPAVGFGMGDVTMRDFLETRGLLPAYRSKTDLYICPVGETSLTEINRIVSTLRKNNLNTAIDLSEKKVGDKIKTADKLAVPFIVCIGEEELKTGKFKIKNLKTGEEKELALEEIPSAIK